MFNPIHSLMQSKFKGIHIKRKLLFAYLGAIKGQFLHDVAGVFEMLGMGLGC